jgi:hypothetical protein
VRWALLVAALVAPSPVAATPLVAPRAGGSVFTGPTSAHVSSIFWNPAAAGLMQGFHLLVAGAARLELTRVSRLAISSADGEPQAAGDRTFPTEEDFVATPGGFIGLTSDLSSDALTVGAAVHMVHSERFPALPSGAYQVEGGGHFGPSLSFTVSYRISGAFYAGVGVSILFPKLDLTFLRDTRLEACTATPCGVEDAGTAERWHVETGYDAAFGGAFDPSVGFNGGTLLRFGEWWVGLAIDFLFLGEVRKEADLVITQPGGQIVNARGRVTYDLPLLAHLGIRRPAFGELELVVNASYTRLSSHDAFDVRVVPDPLLVLPEWIVRHRGMRDAFAVEAGLEQPPATRVRLGGRARVETSAVPSSKVAPQQVDALTLELAGGLELRLSARWALLATASAALLFPVEADPSAFTPSARIDCAASGFDLDTPACAAAREGRAVPTAAGSYFRAGAELTFGFTYDAW